MNTGFPVPRLLPLIKASGFSVQDVARQAGLRPETVWHLIIGKHRAQSGTLGKLARVLGLRDARLLTQEVA
jgi:transcriptional regulator with XRE-family HTH domain